MKMGDIEYQGDKCKVIFYYIVNGCVDFCELICYYVWEFKVKIEMCQIGVWQELVCIGGLGFCGCELCCFIWLIDFKLVFMVVVCYQNLVINQVKFFGQCGCLKCCLNYEFDIYMEVVQVFLKKVDCIQIELGLVVLVKIDIFK